MFDLEKSLRKWRKSLYKNQAFDEGIVEELESHLRDAFAGYIQSGLSEPQAFEKAASEIGLPDPLGEELYKTRSRSLNPHPPWKPGFLYTGLFFNYAKLTFRKLRRQKGYSFINISGLTMGLACCILIMTWVMDEWNFDRFHKDADRIHRIISEDHAGGTVFYYAGTPAPLGPTLVAEYPEIESFARVQSGWDGWQLHYGDKWFFSEKLAAVDPTFFQVFDFTFLKGNPKTALQAKDSIVITRDLAQKCFESEDPMGKIVQIGDNELKVMAVIENIPRQSHIQFDYAFPADNMTQWRESRLDSWAYNQFATYIKVSQKTNPQHINAILADVQKRYLPKSKGLLYVQPLTDIHLNSSHINTWNVVYPNPGNLSSVYIFSLTAFIILLIACINFMNLSTARSGTRAREVGMRKVAGAGRRDLIQQFMGESIALALLSLVLAIVLLELALPYFSELLGKQLTLNVLQNPVLFLGLLGAALLTGLISGSYPSLILSAMKPVKVLKAASPLASSRWGSVRKVLVVVQFACTIALICITAVIYLQLHYMRSKDLGFTKDHIVTFWGGHADTDIMREKLMQNPNITHFTLSDPPNRAPFGVTGFDWDGRDPEFEAKLYPLTVDEYYLETFEMEMAEGRFFSSKFPTDSTEAVVLNETAVQTLGFASPIGKRISFQNPMRGINRNLTIIGVIKDFHQSSLHNLIEPLILWIPDEPIRVCAKIRPDNVPETLAHIENVWTSLVKDRPFEYSFLDQSLNNLYAGERKSAELFRNFTLLTVLIACLGLFGLASFTTEQRTREIGIRKVLGASISSITVMLSREFTKWVIIANVIAWPVAYWVAHTWLKGFAYRIKLGWEIFVLSAVLALMIALFTVVYQAVRAATSDPVDSLRYE